MTSRTVPDRAEILTAFSAVPAPVAVVAAEIAGHPQGMVTSSLATGVSLDPPMISFAVRAESTTWPSLCGAPHLGVSILAHSQEAVSRQIATSPAGSRFDGISTRHTDGGALLIDGAPVQLVCRVGSTEPAGDHHLILLEILHVTTDESIPPLLYHQRVYRSLTFDALS